MSRYRLPAETRPGPVRLQVADLERSIGYYEEILGMRAIERGDGQALLTASGDERPLVGLHQRHGAGPVEQRGRLGLYHFALLVPDRASLGRFVRHLAERGMRPGAADHLVSEAFYLRDPDGLGIEVYADRPSATWHRSGGEIIMASEPLDLDSLLRAAGDERWRGMPPGTVMGHVHLHVGSIDEAQAFYVDALGLGVTTASYPGALFMAAGEYHHHLGANTWAGASAVPPGESDARLLEWTLELPTESDVRAAAGSLERAGHAVVSGSSPGHDRDVVVRDPWGTKLRLTPLD